MNKLVIAALAIISLAGLVSPLQARSKAQAVTNAEEFAQELKSAGQFEIESSVLALQRTKDEAIRQFAQKMIHDHTEAAGKLTETLKQANLPEPAYGQDAEHKDLFNTLFVAEQEPQFVAQYVQDQIQGHEKVVALIEAYLKDGDNEALKQYASTILPMIKEHLKLAEGLRPNVTARR